MAASSRSTRKTEVRSANTSTAPSTRPPTQLTGLIQTANTVTVEWLADRLRKRAAASALILDTAFPDTV